MPFSRAALVGGLAAAFLVASAGPAWAADPCASWPGEPVPLPSTASADPFLARWSVLRATELSELAAQWESSHPAAAGALNAHAACLDPTRKVVGGAAVRVHRSWRSDALRDAIALSTGGAPAEVAQGAEAPPPSVQPAAQPLASEPTPTWRESGVADPSADAPSADLAAWLESTSSAATSPAEASRDEDGRPATAAVAAEPASTAASALASDPEDGEDRDPVAILGGEDPVPPGAAPDAQREGPRPERAPLTAELEPVLAVPPDTVPTVAVPNEEDGIERALAPMPAPDLVPLPTTSLEREEPQPGSTARGVLLSSAGASTGALPVRPPAPAAGTPPRIIEPSDGPPTRRPPVPSEVTAAEVAASRQQAGPGAEPARSTEQAMPSAEVPIPTAEAPIPTADASVPTALARDPEAVAPPSVTRASLPTAQVPTPTAEVALEPTTDAPIPKTPTPEAPIPTASTAKASTPKPPATEASIPKTPTPEAPIPKTPTPEAPIPTDREFALVQESSPPDETPPHTAPSPPSPPRPDVAARPPSLPSPGTRAEPAVAAQPPRTAPEAPPAVSGPPSLDPVRAAVRSARFEEALARIETLRPALAGQGPATAYAELEVLAATASLALGEEGEARLQFVEALKAQPDLELDPLHHSPKVRRLFDAVRREVVE